MIADSATKTQALKKDGLLECCVRLKMKRLDDALDALGSGEGTAVPLESGRDVQNKAPQGSAAKKRLSTFEQAGAPAS